MISETKTIKRPQYRAYLLRLWQVESDGCLVWRASLEDSRTGDRHGFAGMEQLWEYLKDQTGAIPDASLSKES